MLSVMKLSLANIDPFCSDLPIWHPKRSAMKLYVGWKERLARSRFDSVALPAKEIDGINPTSIGEGPQTRPP